jgi:N-acetyl-gamma-glutamyl-phosphate reductase
MLNKLDDFSQKVGVVGAYGYTGMELCKLLLRHPNISLSACFSRSLENSRLSTLLPEVAGSAKVPTYPIETLDHYTDELDTLFLATPAETSVEIVKKLAGKALTVIDLSGGFRLNAEDYKKWYGFEHSAPQVLGKAIYGLVPHTSFPTTEQKQSLLVSNPGCYATSVLMAIIPLLKEGLIDPHSIVIDAKSGTTGAGKKASENLLFTEVEGTVTPYKIGKHQHLPEIIKYTKFFTGQTIDPFFTTSLVPIRRGIISSIYARLNSESSSSDQIIEAFQSLYKDYPFVRISQVNDPSASSLLSLSRVVGSPRTHIVFYVERNKISLFSLIDNLLKGASSQAVENWNCLNRLPVQRGLENVEGVL